MPIPVRKAVFPAAGLGTRFLPATKAQPKEMLPLVDKPLIQCGVEEVVDSGVSHVVIVTGRGKAAIEDHFDTSFELEHLLSSRGKTELLEGVRRIADMASISYVRQKEALGLGHAVLCAKELVGPEPFAVVLSDDVIYSERPATAQLIDVYNRYAASAIALMEVPPERISAYGVVEAEKIGEGLYRVKNLVEKPKREDAPSNLAIVGRYVLTPGIFQAIEETGPGAIGEIQLTDGIRQLAKSEAVYGVLFEGKRYDAGDKLGFLMATVEYALRREDLGDRFREFLNGLR